MLELLLKIYNKDLKAQYAESLLFVVTVSLFFVIYCTGDLSSNQKRRHALGEGRGLFVLKQECDASTFVRGGDKEGRIFAGEEETRERNAVIALGSEKRTLTVQQESKEVRTIRIHGRVVVMSSQEAEGLNVELIIT